jgi:hypothetical protein
MLSQGWLANMNDESELIFNTIVTQEMNTYKLNQNYGNWEDEPDNPGWQRSLTDSVEAISFAPREGHRPVPVLLDTYVEELRFATVFCGQAPNSSVQ